MITPRKTTTDVVYFGHETFDRSGRNDSGERCSECSAVRVGGVIGGNSLVNTENSDVCTASTRRTRKIYQKPAEAARVAVAFASSFTSTAAGFPLCAVSLALPFICRTTQPQMIMIA